MKRRTVRRIPVEAPPDVWLRVRVRPDRMSFTTLSGDFSLPFAALALARWGGTASRWGGLACMVGGVLWIITFVIVQLAAYAELSAEGSIYLEAESTLIKFILDVLPFLDDSVPAVALAFILFGLVGIYIRHQKTHSILGTIGFLISFLGLAFGIMSTLTYGELGFGGSAGCIIPPISSLGYYKAQSGHLILSIGLLFFGIALIRLKILPAKAVALLIVSSLLMQLLDIFWGFQIGIEGLTYNVMEWLIEWGVFAGLAVLFGLAWIWIGRVLWSERSNRRH